MDGVLYVDAKAQVLAEASFELRVEFAGFPGFGCGCTLAGVEIKAGDDAHAAIAWFFAQFDVGIAGTAE